MHMQIGPLSLCLYCTENKVHVVCFIQHSHEKNNKGFGKKREYENKSDFSKMGGRVTIAN